MLNFFASRRLKGINHMYKLCFAGSQQPRNGVSQSAFPNRSLGTRGNEGNEGKRRPAPSRQRPRWRAGAAATGGEGTGCRAPRAVVTRSPDRATRQNQLWHGLLTVPLGMTAGLRRCGRPAVESGGTVRRPCHNGKNRRRGNWLPRTESLLRIGSGRFREPGQLQPA